MITVAINGSLQEKKINLEMFENNPKVTLLFKKLKLFGINIDNLGSVEIKQLMEHILITSR